MLDPPTWLPLPDSGSGSLHDFQVYVGNLSSAFMRLKVTTPLSPIEKLGQEIFFDDTLSKPAGVSCASCHSPDEGYAAHTQFGIGVNKQTGGRNTPVSYNRILSGAQFWDGRAASLEDQAIGPIANPIEMGNTHEAAVDSLSKIPGYQLQFEKIFGELNILTVGAALAAFERAIVTGPSPYGIRNQKGAPGSEVR